MLQRPPSDLVALDVGGANLKAADGLGWAHASPFAMWREWERLPEALESILRPLEPRRLVATMTGEIADCFASRADGVAHIVSAVTRAATAVGATAPAGFYLLDRDAGVATVAEATAAIARPLAAAAANWHAVARLAASRVDAGPALLVDVGSTTTDIVPLQAGRPSPLAWDDAGRMRSGELVYTGVERTPLAAIVRTLPHRGLRRPVAAERFADSRDAWLTVAGLPEAPTDTDTADGRPATREAARIRLARALLLEPADFSRDDAVAAARRCVAAQARLVADAITRVVAASGIRPDRVVLSGHGERLARLALRRAGVSARVISLPEMLGPAVARVAPAHALALVARGMLA